MRIILCGCLGRMGTAINDLVQETPSAKIVLGTDSLQPATPRPYPIKTELAKTEADVLISYLSPQAYTDTNILDYCVAENIPAVICTTALPPHFCTAMEQAAEKIPVFYSANMSFGVTVLEKILAEYSALLYTANFDIELVEKHHNKKLDAPSGTAVNLINTIQSTLPKTEIVTDRTQEKKERTHQEIGVHAIRGGTIVGEHSVIFAGPHETIELTHSATGRQVFAEGTLRAAQYIIGKKPGMYKMGDLIS